MEMMLITCIVASGKVIGSIFFARNKLLRVEKLAVSASPNFIDNSGFQINKDSSRNMLSRTRFAEESVESIMCHTHRGVTAITINFFSKTIAIPLPKGNKSRKTTTIPLLDSNFCHG